MNMKTPMAFAAALALSGCTLMPKYERPPLPVPNEFAAPAGAKDETTAPGWQEYFDDARLRTVIERIVITPQSVAFVIRRAG